MDLKHLLSTAVQITSAIAELHERNIIHQDIRPQNIAGIGAGGPVKLLNPTPDSRFRGLDGAPRGFSVPTESLPYISPEQTGRMNRRVDYLGSGALSAVCGLVMSLAPLSAATFAIGVSSYLFVAGLCYAAVSAVVLEAIGKAVAAASPQYSLFTAACNAAIALASQAMLVTAKASVDR